MSFYSEKRPKHKPKAPAKPNRAGRRADEFPFVRESAQAPLHPAARNRSPR